MALEQKLSLKLAQKLVMTPSLQQAIKLLQMTRLELEGVLNQELVENPVLEENEPNFEEENLPETAESEKTENDEALSDIDLDAYFGDYAESWEGNGHSSVFEERQGPPLENTLTREDDLYDHLLWQLHMMDVSSEIREVAEIIIGNLDPDGFLVASIEEIQRMGVDGEEAADGVKAKDGEEAAESLETTEAAAVEPPEVSPISAGADPAWDVSAFHAAQTPAPTTHTATTLAERTAASGFNAAETDGQGATPSMAPDSPGDVLADGTLPSHVGALPEGSLEELDAVEVEEPVPGYPRDLVLEALEVVRSLEPPGVACADLQESLIRQLDARDEPEDSLARRLVVDKWQEMTHRKFEAIAKDFEIPLKKLEPAVKLIARLNTRPGRQFSNDRTHYVEPDVHVVKVGEEYVVQLNDNGLPRLRVSRAYRKMLQAMRSQGSESEAQQFIKEKMRSAVWLIKSLDQRQRTIYKVATSIVEQQKAFLDYGVDHLRPMVLRDVAEDIEMHESTVSRVVSNKYIHTPRGLLPMKFFFHSGIDREYGGDISSLSVKGKIKHYIQGEEPRKPLSDSELMRILNREGIHIARRTVAKYRDELGIPSSTDRKKIF